MNIESILQPATERLTLWFETGMAMLPNLALAVVIVVVFGLLSSLVRNLVHRTMDRLTVNAQLSGLGAAVARLSVVLVGLFLALSVMNLDKTVTSMLAGLGVAGVALGFAFQDIASNFMSGVMMAARHPFRLGDYVKTGGHEGTVDEMDLRSTTLLTADGIHVTIPNAQVFGNPIVNYTKQDPRRVELAVGVGYGSDLAHVEAVCREVASQMDGLLADRPIQVFFTGFGGSSIDLTIRYWTDNSRPGGWLQSRSDAIQALHRRFDDEGIDIPYPTRTLDMGDQAALRLVDSRTAQAS